MFGSSAMARSIVRGANHMGRALHTILPECFFRWLDKRFNKEEAIMAEGAAFDLVRASVNLVLAALLIIMGTSLRLPLSTTYVTFIVAMGTSLADRAWTRESAVFRITGVLNVIGGWFITAGVAFSCAAFVTVCMYFGSLPASIFFIGLAVYILMRSNLLGSKKKADDECDTIFRQLLAAKNTRQRWELLSRHVALTQEMLLGEILRYYHSVAQGFTDENLSLLRHTVRDISQMKPRLKKARQREMLGLRKVDDSISLKKSTWFHLGFNSGEQMYYGLRRMAEPCLEHVDNNFSPLPDEQLQELQRVAQQVESYLNRSQVILRSHMMEQVDALTTEMDAYTMELSQLRKRQIDILSSDRQKGLRVQFVYLNVLQESQQLLSELRHFMRAYKNFQQ